MSYLMYLFLFIFFFLPTLLFSEVLVDLHQLRPTSEILEGEETHYLFLCDSQEKGWILKQNKSREADQALELICEVLASQIAKALQIPINYVELISTQEIFAHKIIAGELATLHLKVPGVPTSENYPWHCFNVQQKFRTKWMEKKKGPLLDEEKGLTKTIIENMAKDKSLAQIVALDTYLGNMDRSWPNLFYEEKTNSFFGIDMGNIFRGNLAKEALDSLQRIQNIEVTFSFQELEGLKEYGNTLNLLAQSFPPTKIKGMLSEIISKANFSKQALSNQGYNERLEKIYFLVEESYLSTLKLIEELKEISI